MLHLYFLTSNPEFPETAASFCQGWVIYHIFNVLGVKIFALDGWFLEMFNAGTHMLISWGWGSMLHSIKLGEFEHCWCFNPSVETADSDRIFCVSTAMKYCTCHWPSFLASSWLSWFLQSSSSSEKVSDTLEGVTAEWCWQQKFL